MTSNKNFSYNVEEKDENYKYLSKYLFDKYKIGNTTTLNGSIPYMAESEGSYDSIHQTIVHDNEKFTYNNQDIEISFSEDSPISSESEAYSRPCRMKLKFLSNITKEESYKILQELIKNASTYCHTSPDNYISIYVGMYYSWEKMTNTRKRSTDTIYVDKDNNQFQLLLDDINKFSTSEAEYAKFGKPYKRSYLLDGPPGTGKSSMIQALASTLNKSLGFITFDYKTSDKMLKHLMIESKADWIVFEDVDTLFNEDRQTDPERNGITASGFFNVIDGIGNKHGIIYFMTTNHPERLDPALIRAGRVDFRMELSYLTDNQAYNMFNKFCPNKLNDFNKKIKDIIKEHDVSPAILENILFKNYENYNISKIVDDLHELIDYYVSLQDDSKKRTSVAKQTRSNKKYKSCC